MTICPSMKNSKLRWKEKNPEKFKETSDKAQRKYRDLHKDEIARRSKERREKNKISVCDIIKEHDIRHKDDSESLDIRKFLDVEC